MISCNVCSPLNNLFVILFHLRNDFWKIFIGIFLSHPARYPKSCLF